MPLTTGNFQDLVQLELDTLAYLGPDLEIGNTSIGSSATIGFNNSAGDLQLVGVATGNATIAASIRPCVSSSISLGVIDSRNCRSSSGCAPRTSRNRRGRR